MAVIVNRAFEPGIEHARVLVTWGPAEEDLVRRLDQLRLAEAGVLVEVIGGSGPEARVRLVADDGDRLDWVVSLVRAGLGDAVVGEDGATLEGAVVELLDRQGLCLAVAESLTSGLLGARLSEPAGASTVFLGGVVAYASEVKHDVLDVRDGPVVSAEAAAEMAEGVARLLGAQVSVALTGVAGPEESEGRPVGTVFLGSWIEGDARVVELHLPGDRERIRADAAGHALDHLRHRLLARERSSGPHL
jgi:nicotinamide-nucleotide amidase